MGQCKVWTAPKAEFERHKLHAPAPQTPCTSARHCLGAKRGWQGARKANDLPTEWSHAYLRPLSRTRTCPCPWRPCASVSLSRELQLARWVWPWLCPCNCNRQSECGCHSATVTATTGAVIVSCPSITALAVSSGSVVSFSTQLGRCSWSSRQRWNSIDGAIQALESWW